MKRVIPVLGGFAALLVLSTPAFAQQTRKVAVTATAPSGIGILWHVSDQVAVRPEFSFQRTSTETSGATVVAGTATSWLLGSGGSVLFYTGKWDNLRAYVSPRFAFAHTKSTSTTGSTSSNPTSYTISGSAGAQYSLGDRFAVFGEWGLNYGWQSASYTSSIPAGSFSTKTSAFGTGTRIGVAIYF